MAIKLQIEQQLIDDIEEVILGICNVDASPLTTWAASAFQLLLNLSNASGSKSA